MRSEEGTFGVPLRVSAFVLGALLLLALSFFTPVTSGAQAQTNRAPLGAPVPVTGTLPDGTLFEGVIQGGVVTVENGQAFLSGVLKGTVTDPVTGEVTKVTQKFSGVPLNVFTTNQQSCEIVFLDVEPIFLEVLGLQVDLSQITLDITAQPGPSNQLGTLLCEITGLLA